MTTQVWTESFTRKTSTIRSARAGSAAPINWRTGCPGWDSGPRTLNTVGIPSPARMGPANRIAGWNVRAKANPIRCLTTCAANCSGAMSISTPRTSRTSKAPEVDEARRFPCLQTVAPPPAATKQAMVETFRLASRRLATPPVPTMSIVPSGRTSGSAMDTIARTSPLVSSTVSPLTFSPTRKPAICAGSASPLRISPRMASVSSAERSSLRHSRSSSPGQPPWSSRLMRF